jgi:hypothetical protein
MGLGLVVMVVGVGYSILNQLPQLNLPQFLRMAQLSIFVGAVLWLAGPVLAAMSRSATATGGCATTINAAVVISIVTANQHDLRTAEGRCAFVSLSLSLPFSRHITPPSVLACLLWLPAK